MRNSAAAAAATLVLLAGCATMPAGPPRLVVDWTTPGLANPESVLPSADGTFLYVSKATADHDILMAYDGATGQARTLTDLRGDGSEGWSIDGYSLSPDRTRIAAASLYGATQADVDTKLPTQRIWTFATDGGWRK